MTSKKRLYAQHDKLLDISQQIKWSMIHDAIEEESSIANKAICAEFIWDYSSDPDEFLELLNEGNLQPNRLTFGMSKAEMLNSLE